MTRLPIILVVVVCVVVAIVVPLAVILPRNNKNEDSSLASTSSSATTSPSVPSNNNKKKNVILILADDLGIRDLGCYNNDPNATNRFYETPHLDALATQSVLFENAYSAYATCAESRAGLLAGMYPSRMGIVDVSRLRYTGFEQEWRCARYVDNWGAPRQKVPLLATILPEALLAHGYRTALVGKWHSGTPQRGQPWDHGFEITVMNTGGLGSHLSPYRCGPSGCWGPPGNITIKVENGTMSSNHLTMEAVKLIREEFSGEEPFFLMLSHYAVHTPIVATKNYTQPFDIKRWRLNQQSIPLDVYAYADGLFERQTQDHPVYAGLLKSLDDSLGHLMESLAEMSLLNDTIIVFTSDNGGKAANFDLRKSYQAKTSNLPFKAAKEFVGDGGIRVPMMIYAPGMQPHRSVFYSHGVDIYPTILDLADLPLQPQDHFDGTSLLPAMLNQSLTTRETPLFWQDAQECFTFRTPNESKFRCTDASYVATFQEYKLIQRVYSNTSDNNSTFELYHLASDPGERINLVESMVDKVEEMKSLLQEWKRTWFDNPYFEKLRRRYNNCT